MPEPKTKKTDASVDSFVAKVAAARQDDTKSLIRLFGAALGAPPKMWGSSIIGFGDGSYEDAAGKSIPWFVAGFAVRAQNFALYIPNAMSTSAALLPKLGKHSTGKSCLYIRSLADVDEKVLAAIVHAGRTKGR